MAGNRLCYERSQLRILFLSNACPDISMMRTYLYLSFDILLPGILLFAFVVQQTHHPTNIATTEKRCKSLRQRSNATLMILISLYPPLFGTAVYVSYHTNTKIPII